MKKQRYTAEFKKEAAKMMIIDGVTVKEASDQLGVPAGVLYTWKHKYLDEMEVKNTHRSSGSMRCASVWS